MFWDLNNHESEQARQDYFKTASKIGQTGEQAANANAERREANVTNDLDQRYTVHTDQSTRVTKASAEVQALVWRQKPPDS